MAPRPAAAEPAGVALTAAELDSSFADTQPGEGGDHEAGEGRRRRGRRGGRNRSGVPTSATPSEVGTAADTAAPPAGTVAAPAAADEAERVAETVTTITETARDEDSEPASAAAGERRGRRRRPRRDRREDAAADQQGEDAITEGEVLDGQVLAAGDDADPTSAAGEPEPYTAPPAAVPAVNRPLAVAPARIEPYVLPIDELVEVARSAGLEWVGSDADKVRAAQQTIAEASHAIRVPRERKPAPVIDEGPLVLVETRRDLAQMKLPFELEAR